MDNTLIQLTVIALLFIIIFASGYRLNKTEKPYNTITFNIHKLIGLAVIAYLIVKIYNINRVSDLSLVEWIICVITGILFIVAIVSGGLLSIEKSVSEAIKKMHKAISFLTVLSTALTLYLILNHN